MGHRLSSLCLPSIEVQTSQVFVYKNGESSSFQLLSAAYSSAFSFIRSTILPLASASGSD